MKAADLFSVEGLRVLVTGGASGIGLGYVEAMAGNGAKVTILDLRQDRIDEQVARLRDQGFEVRGALCDVSDYKALNAAFDEAAAAYGGIDVVFANAGIDVGLGYRPDDPAGNIENMPPEIWQQSIGVNFTGVFWTIQAAVRHMKPNKNGRIIVTTSAASRGIHARVMAAYPAAKAGIMHLVRRAAIELAPDGIRVNAIAPGIFVTNIGGGHMHKPEARKMMEARVPLGFAAETSEIHGAAIFLASHAGRYVTGEEILVDGGLLLGHR